MRDAFICHSEKDHSTTLEIVRGLEAAGYTTWYYERDNVPGESYLIQVGRAIEDARCVVLLVSRDSLVSMQVTSEVVRAYEARIPFLPLLLHVTHREVQERQEIWRQALVTSTSLPVPAEGIGAVMPRVVRGLENLGIRPSGASTGAELPPAPPPRAKRPWLTAPRVLVGALLIAAVLVGMRLLRGEEKESPTREPAAISMQAPVPSPEPAAATGPAAGGDVRTSAPVRPASESRRELPPASVATEAAPPRDEPPEAASLPPADLAIHLSDSNGSAQRLLVEALRSQGVGVLDTTAQADWGRTRDLLSRGDGPSRARTLAALNVRAALIGEVRYADVAQVYGLYAVRAEIAADWFAGDSGQAATALTAAEKASRPTRETAARAAVEAAIAELARKLQAMRGR